MSGHVCVTAGPSEIRNMDNKFPAQLFPHFYLDGPPDLKTRHNYSGWGAYDKVLKRDTESAQFQSQRGVDGDLWVPVEPVVTPILPPNKAAKFFSGPPYSPDDFPEHMHHFYIHHYMDTFSSVAQPLGEHFNFGNRHCKNLVSTGRIRNFLDSFRYQNCVLMQTSEHMNRYHSLLHDFIGDVPTPLLAELLHEELTLQKDLELFQPAATGGALGCCVLQEYRGQRDLCLIYPRGEALDSLNFHRVELEFSEGKPPKMNMDNNPLEFGLTGPARQISVAEVDDEVYVGVRSDYLCASWVIKDCQRPRSLEVVQLKERCTSLNVSPHVPGELVVTSESGAAYLWTVGKQPVVFREEGSNMYFNAKSAWRWCEFSAHPRVMVYADRTGVELTDIRTSDCSYTLFRIGKPAGCQSGERMILSKYLGQSHAHHHLITTQFSAYIVDERMPSIPALKWEHMMESPPCFAHVLPASGSSNTSKILLGAQRGQETLLLQYSGGREQPCRSDGPLQKLCSPRESLKLRLLPHRRHKAEERLAVPAAGLAATQNGEFMSVFQLTEAGDLFCQTLKLHSPNSSEPPRSVGSVEPPFNLNSARPALVSGEKQPTQETQNEDRERGILTSLDDGESSDSDCERQRHRRMLSQVEVVVNDEQEDSHASDAEERISCEAASVPDSSMRSAQISRVHPVRPASQVSSELKLIWKKWLEALFKEATVTKPKLDHNQVRIEGKLQIKSRQRDKLEEDKFENLRKEMTNTMKNRKLLVHGGTYLPSQEVVPVPHPVDPSDWTDDLSQRLAVSWAGGWKNWWDEKLGLNRDAKIEALRRKRRREKRAKAKGRVSLSGSFTSSSSYQDDLSGWSSNTSQHLSSDAESFLTSQSGAEDGALSEPETLPKSPVVERVSTSQPPRSPSPVTEPIKPPSSLIKTKTTEQNNDSQTPKHLPGQALKASLSSQQKQNLRQQQQDYLSSLFSSQEPSQDPGQDEDGTSFVSSRPTILPFASRRPSQHRISSQASQPQKKKSRMGF